jgi:hypothetical protein
MNGGTFSETLVPICQITLRYSYYDPTFVLTGVETSDHTKVG